MDEHPEFPALTSLELPGYFISSAASGCSLQHSQQRRCQRRLFVSALFLTAGINPGSLLPPLPKAGGRVPAASPALLLIQQRDHPAAGAAGSRDNGEPVSISMEQRDAGMLLESTSWLPCAPRCCLPTEVPVLGAAVHLRARKYPDPHPLPPPGALHHKAREFPRIAAQCLPGSPGADEVLMGAGIGIGTQGVTAASRFPSQLGKTVGNTPPAPSLKWQRVEWRFGMQGCLRGQGWCLWIGNVILLGGLLSWKWRGKRGGSESCVLQ